MKKKTHTFNKKNMGCCCSNDDSEYSTDDPEANFKIPEGLPEPGPGPKEPENPVIAPNHISQFYNVKNPYEGRDELQEKELSPVSDETED